MELDRLSDRPVPLSMDLVPAVEFHGRSNTDLPFLHGYDDQAPIVSVPSGVYVDDFLALEADFDLRQDPTSIDSSNYLSNIIPDFSYYDVSMPHRSYGAVQGQNWALALAREKLEIGVGSNSRLIVSDTPHFIDRLQFTLYFEVFQYFFALAYFEPWLTSAETADDNTYWDYSETSEEEAEASKYLALHRFDFRPWPWLNLALTEGLMYGGKYPDLRLLNPLQIFHSFYEWEYSASIFSIEAAVTPLRGINLYGQFMFNQIQSTYEIERYGADAIPNARGWRAGAEASTGIGPGIFKAVVEYTHTDPWLYIRENPLITYSWRRKVTSNVDGTRILTLPLGFVHGPDTDSFWAQASYFLPGFGQAALSGEYWVDGDKSITTPYAEGQEAATETTPSGAKTSHVDIRLDISADPLPFLRTELGLGVSIRTIEGGSAEAGFEWLASVSLSAAELVDSIRERQ